MTISSTASSVTYQGNGATTVFPFTFLIPLASNAVVTLTDNSQSPAVVTGLGTSQFSISGLGNSAGGAVTCSDPATGAPIAAGKTLTISRVVPYSQPTDIVNQDGFFPEVLEGAIDNVVMQCQQLAARLALAVTVPPGGAVTPSSVLSVIQTAMNAAATSASGAANSAAMAAVQAASAALAQTAAAASAAALPNAAAIGLGKIPQSTGTGWIGVTPGAGTVTSVATAGLATGGPISGSGTVTVTASTNALAQAGTDTTTAMTPASTAAAIATLGVSTSQITALQQDVIQNYLLDAINGAWAAGQYSNGGYDAFNSDTLSGVSGTSGQTYDGTNKLYSNPTVAMAQIPQAIGTAIGNMIGQGGLAAAYDGVDNKAVASSCINGAPAATGIVGKDYGSGNGYAFDHFEIISTSNVGYLWNSGTPVISVYGTTDGGTSGGALIGTTGAFSDPAGTSTMTIVASDKVTVYRGYYVTIGGADGSSNPAVAQVKAYKSAAAAPAMKLVTAALNPAPATAPTRAQVMVLWKDNSGGAALNTDFTAEVTANGGANWVTGTLADIGITMAGGYHLLATTVTLSSGGTTVQTRLKTLNNKAQLVKAVGLMTS